MTALAGPDAGMVPMLEELQKQIASADGGAVSRTRFMEQEYDRKKSEIRKLVTSIKQLEAGSVSVQYINEEIQRLDGECAALDKRMKAVQEEAEHEKTEVTDPTGEISAKLGDFSKVFEQLPILQKRDFLRQIIAKVVWDGETAHIYL